MACWPSFLDYAGRARTTLSVFADYNKQAGFLSATLDFTGAGSSSAATVIPAAEVGAATSLGGSAPVNISHQNTGPDPPQLYGSSWEHGSWGRNKAKRGQVRLIWISRPLVSPLHNNSSAQREQRGL